MCLYQIKVRQNDGDWTANELTVVQLSVYI